MSDHHKLLGRIGDPVLKGKLKWPDLPKEKREEEKAKYTWRNGAKVRKP